MPPTQRTAEITHIRELVADPENRRKHNPRNIGMVVDALQQIGAARSIVIDEDGVVLAGNGVSEAAAEAGITKVRVVDVDGSELVAVRRVGLTPEQKRALALYDNRTGELAEWSAEQLQADLDAGLDLKPWFSEDEISAVLAAANDPAASAVGTGDAKKLADRFLLPPFSVLNAREGWWQERKAAWLALGIESELGRGMENLNGSHPETTSTIDFYAQKRALEARLGRLLTKDEAAAAMSATGTLKDARQANRQRKLSPGGGTASSGYRRCARRETGAR